MIDLIILFFLVGITFSFAKKNPIKFIGIYVLDLFFLPLLMFKLVPSIAPLTGTVLHLILLFYFVFLFGFKKNNINTSYIFILIIALTALYMFLLAMFRGIPVINYFLFIRNYYFNILFFIILYNLPKKEKYNPKKLILIFLFIFLIEGLLGYLQYANHSFSDFFKVVSYDWKGKTTITLSRFIEKQKVVIGTLERPTNYGNILAVLGIVIFGFIYYKMIKLKKIFFYLVILSFVPVFLTGIRTSVLTLLIGIFLIIFFENKKLGIIIISSFILILSSYYTLLSTLAIEGVNSSTNLENPVQRLFGLFFLLFDPSSFKSGTITLFRTMNLIPYFFQNPLFGVGKYFMGGYLGIESITDAYLLFHLTEFGIVGVTFIFLPFIYVLHIVKKNTNNKSYHLLLTVFIVLFMQTITDNGMFTIILNAIFYILGGILLLEFKGVKN